MFKMAQETSLSRDFIEKLTPELFCIEIGEDENLHLFRHVSEIIHESKGGIVHFSTISNSINSSTQIHTNFSFNA